MLDNARDEDQVRPLIPPPGASLTLITSRNRLGALAEVHTVSVDLIGPAPF